MAAITTGDLYEIYVAITEDGTTTNYYLTAADDGGSATLGSLVTVGSGSDKGTSGTQLWTTDSLTSGYLLSSSDVYLDPSGLATGTIPTCTSTEPDTDWTISGEDSGATIMDTTNSVYLNGSSKTNPKGGNSQTWKFNKSILGKPGGM